MNVANEQHMPDTTVAESEASPSPFKRIGRAISKTFANLRDAWEETWVNFRNWRRVRRGDQLDYVILTLTGPFPERAAPRRNFIQRRLPLPAPPLSMQGFNRRLQLIADADNAHGVILLMRNLGGGLATWQNLRSAIERFRATGKEVVVYTPLLDMRHYFVASAADRIVAPPSARFDALGLYTEVTFLKDTLARAGISVDVIQISPYKSAFDQLGQSDLTPEFREQLDWLLDEQFDLLTAAMAAGRSLPPEKIRSLIDQSPLSVEQALAEGLIDAIAYDDQLPALLGEQAAGTISKPSNEPPATQPAKLITWGQAHGMLLEKHRRATEKFVGVISLEGAITMGASQSAPIPIPIPFLGGESVGEQTAVSLLRRAEKIEDMAALILHIDSGGGSALASDLIARQVSLLARKKPVLVYMGNIAASGGYYIAAPAQEIWSQTGTITGSIGVIMAHVATADLMGMLSVNRATLGRGAHAGLYTNTDELSDESRSILWQEIAHTYDQFKAIVANGRKLPLETLDPICEGRVWTGRQARERGLVDDHGDFIDAIVRAAELGGIPTDDPAAIDVANLYSKSSAYVVPSTDAGAIVQQFSDLVAGERFRDWNGRALMLLPFDLRQR